MFFEKTIPNPEADPEFQRLRKEQNQAHDAIRKNSEIVEKYKRQTIAAESLIGAQAHANHRPSRADEAKARAASAAVHAGRAELRRLEPLMREARSAACKKIRAELSPQYLALIGEYARAYLAARADELAALGQILAMRDEFDVRQISLGDLPIPPFERSLERTEWQYSVVAQDTLAMIQCGALKPADVPKALRKLWRL